MCRIPLIFCAALAAQGDAQFLRSLGIQSYSMSWTSVSQGAGGQAVQETHGFSRDGEATQEVRSVLTQDGAGAMHGTKDEVRCVGSHCAELLTVVGPASQEVQLRGAEAPCHKKHVAAVAAQMAQAASADGGVPAMLPGDVLPTDVSAGDPPSEGVSDAQMLRFFAVAAFAAAAVGACLGVAAVRVRKAGARVTELQTLQQFLLPGREQGTIARRPTAQDDLRSALCDLENNAVEAYVMGLYARGAYKADIADTKSEARAYVQQLCERACLA